MNHQSPIVLRDEPRDSFHPSALRSGALAPGFSLVNGSGQTISLEHLRKKGPVVLYFYRGAW